MTIDISKLPAYFMTGDPSGLNVSKFVVYAMFELGDEPSAPAPVPKQGYSYAQVLRAD